MISAARVCFWRGAGGSLKAAIFRQRPEVRLELIIVDRRIGAKLYSSTSSSIVQFSSCKFTRSAQSLLLSSFSSSLSATLLHINHTAPAQRSRSYDVMCSLPRLNGDKLLQHAASEAIRSADGSSSSACCCWASIASIASVHVDIHCARPHSQLSLIRCTSTNRRARLVSDLPGAYSAP